MFHNLFLTNTELDAQLATIVGFLSTVHPELTQKTSKNTCVELRPINRSPSDYNIRLNRSLNLWKLDDKSIDRLREYLYKHNGEPYCMYYSVFAFDYDKDSYTKAGKKAVKGKITSDAALFTNEIVLDFDDLNYLGFSTLLNEVEKMGINGLWVFTGHGYQLHILLDKPLYNVNSLLKLVYLFRSRGFMCDTSCVDSARLMRLPFTYNCKVFSSEQYDYEYNNPPLCKIVKETKNRYSYEDVIDKVLSKPVVNELDEKSYLDILKYEKTKGISDISQKVEGLLQNEKSISLDRVDYPQYLQFDSLPEPVINMLRNTPEGFRNETLGFLISYLKQYMFLGKQQLYEVLHIWNTFACDPPFPEDMFTKDFERLYQGGGLPYSRKAANFFGSINFESQIQLHRKNKVLIPNAIFKNLASIDANVLRVYLAIKVLEHGNSECDDEDMIAPTVTSIEDVSGVSIRSLKRILPMARKMGLIYIKQGYKRNGEQSTYHTNEINSYDYGFKALSVNDLDIYLSTSQRLKLADNELKLYLFMLYKFYTNERAMSLKKMGEFIGLTESAVSKLCKSLRKKRYLKIERVYKDKVVFYNKYTLLK